MKTRLIAALLVAPLAGCSLFVAALGRPENVECKDYVFSGLVDLAAAALVGAISYAEDGGTGGTVAAGVLGASALVGFTGALVCDARRERRTSAAVYYPRGSSEPPESLRLDPQSDGVRDATPEELGLVPKAPSTDLKVHTEVTPPDAEKELDSKVGESYSSKPAVQPTAPPPPTCQLSPRIDCPQRSHCVLTEENRGVCEPIL